MRIKDFDTLNTEKLKDLLDLMTAYQRSQVLFALVNLEIPQLLTQKNFTIREIAEEKQIHPLAMDRFLNAAVSLGLLQKKNELYSNSEITEDFLVKGKKFYLGGQIERQQKRSFSVWQDLANNLKQWDYGSEKNKNPETEDQGAEAMTEQHQLALLQGFALAKAFDLSNFKRILDLGGGTGATSIALCKAFPKLNSIVFDLPENAGIAQKFIKDEGLTDRILTIGGDFKKDKLPDDFDAVILANFMSVADAEENQKLLQTLYQKLPNNGVCLLSGWIIDDSHLSPEISVLFCLEDICWDAPDVERSEKIYRGWLEKAGFRNIECQTYLEPTKMLYGFKNIEK